MPHQWVPYNQISSMRFGSTRADGRLYHSEDPDSLEGVNAPIRPASLEKD
jgi:hypothetical protein